MKERGLTRTANDKNSYLKFSCWNDIVLLKKYNFVDRLESNAKKIFGKQKSTTSVDVLPLCENNLKSFNRPLMF